MADHADDNAEKAEDVEEDAKGPQTAWAEVEIPDIATHSRRSGTTPVASRSIKFVPSRRHCGARHTEGCTQPLDFSGVRLEKKASSTFLFPASTLTGERFDYILNNWHWVNTNLHGNREVCQQQG